MSKQAISELRIKDLMSTEVVTLEETLPIKDAWARLVEHRISGAPVVDAANNLVGMVSQHDLLMKIFADSMRGGESNSFYFALPSLADGFVPSGDELHKVLKTPIRKVMNPHVITVKPDESFSMVAAIMRENHIHRVVVAEGKKIVGIVSTFDVLSLVEQKK